MVRLKASGANIETPSLPYFNSNMVRLKVGGWLRYYPYKNNFNSNMVRLKALTHNQLSKMIKGFQFQYGAIKSAWNLV